jgi:hypothetical protein
MNSVDVCNLALSHIGNSANVQAIVPPDGSVESKHCARFYPIALKMILEKGCWGFNTRRASLAEVDNPSTTWLHAYAVPDKMVNALSVLPEKAVDDYSVGFPVRDGTIWPQGYVPIEAVSQYEPQPYQIETNADGASIILTNVEAPVLRYTVLVDDANQFTPMFVVALSHLLASFLAGPIIKGDTGSTRARSEMALFAAIEGDAEASDANQRRIRPGHVVPWIAGR